tara:strand:+ start:533 stop:1519 length:987 start_codon:yes stop_codon:yes gene_type:complete
MREPCSTSALREIFLNQDEAAACDSLAEAVALGHSILTLDGLATNDEVATLKAEAVEAAGELAASPEGERTTEQRIVEMRAAYIKAGVSWRTRTAVNGDGGASWHRLKITDNLEAPGQALCDALLLQALSLVGVELVQYLFGDRIANSPATCVHNPQLAFSPHEPAVNVYFAGGAFKAHQDKQSLTVLVPLSDTSEFDGGGTAFWSLADAGPGASKGSARLPTMVLRPPAGTAMIWGGSVLHSGLPVEAGQRCVFVASFSPTNTPDNKPSGPASRPAATKRTSGEAGGGASPPSEAEPALLGLAELRVGTDVNIAASHRRMAEILRGR